MFQTSSAQRPRSLSAASLRRSRSWLDRKAAYPEEHHHSHPRYHGLHLVTFEDRLGDPAPPGRIRRLLSAFWEPGPRKIRQIERRTRPAA